MAAAAEWEVSLEPADWDNLEREPFQRQFIDPEAFVSKDGDFRREKLGIVIEDDGGVCVPAPVASFEELGVFPDYAFWGMKENGVTAPMPIQAQALPLVLAGHDVVGLAQTGSGKTLSFLLPAVVHIEAQQPLEWCAATPIALVLAPTRELAVQIAEEASKVLRHSRRGKHPGGCWAVCLYGGGNKRDQVRSLSKGAHIVAATPGRLIDLLTAKAVSLERVTYFVLDEADRMLDMGFQGDVAAISGQIRPERQVLFFSATWSRSVQTLARGLCYKGSQPVRIAVGQCVSSAGGGAGEEGEEVGLKARAGILQDVIVVDYPNEWDKQAAEKRKLLEEYLRTVLGRSKDNKVLVFVSQKTLADELCSLLWEAGFHSGAMHGGKPQENRLWTLDRFRKGELQLLVATDVLGRGIDIPSISHVVVYDMGSLEDYIHRIGRTARGKNAKGCALVFFEYYFRDPQIAGNLIAVLEAAEQPVPRGLRRIAEEVERGARDTWDPRANWGKGMKINGNASVGVGVDGNWDRHLEAAATAGGGSSADGNRHEPEPQVSFKVIPVPTWLAELDKMNTSATGAGGSMQQFAPTLQQRNLDTVGDVLAEYAPDQVFAAEDFFRDIGVKKYGHKNVFRKWFREICAGG